MLLIKCLLKLEYRSFLVKGEDWIKILSYYRLRFQKQILYIYIIMKLFMFQELIKYNITNNHLLIAY